MVEIENGHVCKTWNVRSSMIGRKIAVYAKLAAIQLSTYPESKLRNAETGERKRMQAMF